MRKDRNILRTIILLGFILGVGNLYAQQDNIDSLKRVVASEKIHDTLKIKAYALLTKSYRYSNYDSMRYYAERGLILSKKQNDLSGQAEAYFQVGSYYLNTLKYDTALYYFDESVKLFQKIEANFHIYRCYNSIGMAYVNMENIDSGIYYYEKAKEGFVKLGNEYGQAAIEVNIGIEYYHNGDIAEAIKRLENAIKLFESIGNISERALAYRNLGQFYHSIGDYKKGTESLAQAIKFAQKSGNKLIESGAYSNIGIMFAQQEQLTESITYFKKCYELSSEVNDTINIIVALNNMGDNYFRMDSLKKSMKMYEEALRLYRDNIPLEQKANSLTGIALIHEKNKDYKNAEDYFKQALKLSSTTSGFSIYSTSLIAIGNFYLEIGRLKDAEYHFEKALANTDEHWNIEAFRDASKGLFNVHKKLKNYEKALTYYIQHVEFKDSISNKKNSQKLIKETLNLQHQNEIAQIELEQKEKELIAEKEKAKQVALKNYFMVGFAFVFIMAVIIFLSLRKNRKKNKELKELNEEIQTQKELILSQNEELTITNEKLLELGRFKEAMTGMIVHDLKNPLNAILNLQGASPVQAIPLVMQSGKQMLNMILNILDVYKYEESQMVLDKSNCSLISLITNSIRGIEFLSEQKNIKIENTLKGNIGIYADADVLERVFINLLTNAIKYTPSSGLVTISGEIDKRSNFIRISVSDTGPGIPEDKLMEVFDKFAQIQAKDSGKVRSTGLGLPFCKLAIEAHGGEIGVDSRPGQGSCFWFTLSTVASKKNASGSKNFELNESAILPKLTPEETLQIKDSLNRLRGTKIYQISKLRKILAEIDGTQSENIRHWKTVVEKAIQTEAQETFSKLVG